MRGFDEENAVALTDLAEESGEDRRSDEEDDGMTRLSTSRSRTEKERERRERDRLTPRPSPRIR